MINDDVMRSSVQFSSSILMHYSYSHHAYYWHQQHKYNQQTFTFWNTVQCTKFRKEKCVAGRGDFLIIQKKINSVF
jgi:hypothetical protein